MIPPSLTGETDSGSDSGGSDDDGLAFSPGYDAGGGSTEDDGGSDEGFYDAPESPESQEADPVTYEDVAGPEDLDSEAAVDAVSDDANQNDTVDETTSVTNDSGDTYTNVGGSGSGDSESPEWAELPDTGVETEPTEGIDGSEVDGTTAGESVDNATVQNAADRVEDAVSRATGGIVSEENLGSSMAVAAVAFGSVGLGAFYVGGES